MSLGRLFLAPAVPSSLCALAGLRGRLVAEGRDVWAMVRVVDWGVIRWI